MICSLFDDYLLLYLVGMEPAFISSNASHPAGVHVPACPNNGNWDPIAGGGGSGRNNFR